MNKSANPINSPCFIENGKPVSKHISRFAWEYYVPDVYKKNWQTLSPSQRLDIYFTANEFLKKNTSVDIDQINTKLSQNYIQDNIDN